MSRTDAIAVRDLVKDFGRTRERPLPPAGPVAWGVLAACFVVSEIGPLLDLPGWVGDLSPYAHVPHLPGGEFVLGPLLALVGVASALLLLGLAAVRHRDIATA